VLSWVQGCGVEVQLGSSLHSQAAAAAAAAAARAEAAFHHGPQGAAAHGQSVQGRARTLLVRNKQLRS